VLNLELLRLDLALLFGLSNFSFAVMLFVLDLVLKSFLLHLVGLLTLLALLALLLVVVLRAVGSLLQGIDLAAEFLLLLRVRLYLLLRRREPVSDQFAELIPSLVELGQL